MLSYNLNFFSDYAPSQTESTSCNFQSLHQNASPRSPHGFLKRPVISAPLPLTVPHGSLSRTRQKRKKSSRRRKRPLARPFQNCRMSFICNFLTSAIAPITNTSIFNVNATAFSRSYRRKFLNTKDVSSKPLKQNSMRCSTRKVGCYPPMTAICGISTAPRRMQIFSVPNFAPISPSMTGGCKTNSRPRRANASVRKSNGACSPPIVMSSAQAKSHAANGGRSVATTGMPSAIRNLSSPP